jgi:hypothetical protein
MIREVNLSWAEIAELTHKKQVEYFNFCVCEDGDGERPYADCPKEKEDSR